MSDYTLLLLEATGIQDYVFGSNDLGQNIGASELVMQATGNWIGIALDDLKIPHNLKTNGKPNRDQPGFFTGARAQVIYCGTGNALILFANENDACALIQLLTQRALMYAPGLTLARALHTGKTEQDVFPRVLADLHIELAKRKANRAPSAAFTGLGVTAACAYTGLPAINQDREGRLISALVAGKLDARNEGENRLHTLFPDLKKTGFDDFLYDFDDLGEEDVSSYLAVVHTDGNRMGERIENLGKQFTRPDQNEKFIQALGEWSDKVTECTTNALRSTVNQLIASFDGEKFGGKVPLPKSRDGKKRLPFRPIVFGGDDVTFVCDGRLGLTLAAHYLDTLTHETLTDQIPFFARAGIAVVKAHFPFSRAYELADDLAKSARDYIRAQRNASNQEDTLSALDWHFAVGGLVRELDEIRKREYTTSEGKLFLRPLRITQPEKDRVHSWEAFARVVNEFQTDEKNWVGRHNQIKALRDALREGTLAVEQFRKAHDLAQLPELDETQPDFRLRGWQGKVCGYWDAIEALDFFVPLKGA
ncbi:MAG: hypothetical protein HZC40_08125 [Chloroflexi bacterium]|nr:hypothetical protein [Chloroflexota bacterium]